MRDKWSQRVLELVREGRKRKRCQKVVTFLAAIVVFCTTYALILPAITLETACGYEEHVHEAACYENEDMTGLLICMEEEHEHVETCYPEEDPEAISEDMEEESTAVDSESTLSDEISTEEDTVNLPEASEDDLIQEEDPEEELNTGNEEIIEETTEENTASEETEEIIEEVHIEQVEDAADTASDLAVTLSGNDVEEITEEIAVFTEEAMTAAVSEESEGTLVDQGTLTETISWKLVEDEFGYRTLIVEGQGAMPNYSNYGSNPWYREYRTFIDKIEIREGITTIGVYGLSGIGFTELEIASSVVEICNCAFSNGSNRSRVIDVTIPGTVKKLVVVYLKVLLASAE